MVENPDYGILIVGYSLGGGVASLITEELLYHQRKNEDVPNETMIRCITYGAPPTYSCPNNYKNPNIFSMKNHNDCVRKIYRINVNHSISLLFSIQFNVITYIRYFLAAAHLNAVSRLFEKMSHIRRLQMEPGVMIDMFMKKGFLEIEEIRDLDQIKEIKEYTGIMSENWAKVDTLVNFQITYN